MSGFSSNVVLRISRGANREKVILVGLLAVAAFLAFYNLGYAPRPWHDEGSALAVPRTLVEDGIYAMQSSEGHQTFGAIQSVGPTVLVPVALSFKLFGIGLVQGRIVIAVYFLLTLAMFYGLGRELFGPRAAVLAIVLLLGSQSARFLFFGRQVLGEVPALGFILGGLLVWSRGVQTGRRWLYPIAGLLVGAAMVTKTTYVLIGFGMLGLGAILDLFYYRQGYFRALTITGVVASACVAAYWGWQVTYYGVDTFLENAAKLRQLGSSTTGFNLRATAAALKLLVGSESGHFYYWWGFPALIYAGVSSCRRNHNSFILASLVIFALLWLGYYFWSMPWQVYLFAPAAITAMFVGKLWHDLADGFNISWHQVWSEIRQGKPARITLIAVALPALGLIAGYPLQNTVQVEVLQRSRVPEQVAAFLDETIDRDSVIETWERELGILTDHRYHFPDQSLLTQVHATPYRGGSRDYALGADYFQAYRPSYLVLGWYAKWNSLYDTDFLAEHGDLLATISDDWVQYDVYELHLP